VSGHIFRSQRAIFPLIVVGATKDFTNLLITSRDLKPVTVTLSTGSPVGDEFTGVLAGGTGCEVAAMIGSISMIETALAPVCETGFAVIKVESRALVEPLGV
jgi:hypothetical protein